MEKKEPSNKFVWQAFGTSVVAVSLSIYGYSLNHWALGLGVFLLVPFCTGLVIAFMSKGSKMVAITSMISFLLSPTLIVFGGGEGVLCVIMAFPIIFASIWVGSLVGFFLEKKFKHKNGNMTVILFCLGSMSFVGWTNQEMKDPELLKVRSHVKIHAPMERVWAAVTASGSIEGDDFVLRALGMPVPKHCSLDEDGNRTCYFDEGQIRQKVTKSEYGRRLEMDIVESFEVRPWLTFLRADYSFIQRDGYVEVIRTDEITSTLRPRWYWYWFETQCVRMEHRYVMSSMKRKAEQAHR